MFKKLLPLLFLFAGFQVNAALFQFQFEDTISFSTIPGLLAGQSATITLGLDNGGSSHISQVWTASDLQSVTFDFNNGGEVTSFNSPWAGGLVNGTGDIVTDASGNLTRVMDNWSDLNIGSFFSTNGLAIPYESSWFLDGHNWIYRFYVGFAYDVDVKHPQDILNARQWSLVSVVPEPSIIALFGLGLVGIGFARRRRS
jgi:hypothetical protein